MLRLGNKIKNQSILAVFFDIGTATMVQVDYWCFKNVNTRCLMTEVDEDKY